MLAEQLVLSMATAGVVSFEIICHQRKIALQVVIDSDQAQHVIGCIRGLYPNAEVFVSGDLLTQATRETTTAHVYRLRESHFLPLRTDFRLDPYGPLFGALAGLSQNEFAALQILLVPVDHNWRANIITASRDEYEPNKSPFYDLPQLPKLADQKASKPLYAVSARIATSSGVTAARFEGFWRQFDGSNGFVMADEHHPPWSAFQRTTCASGMILNAEELAAIAHLPDPGQLAVGCLELATITAPAPRCATNELIHIGRNRHQGNETRVGISAEWLTRHVTVFGQTGTGKTNLLKRCFAPLMDQNFGLCVLDPAGDCAEEIIDMIPAHRIDDVIYFNPGDRAHPPALNVLCSSNQDREMLASELMICLKRLFKGSSEIGPRMEWVLRQSVRTLLESEGEKTLRDIPRLLADDRYREEVLRTVHDADIKWFWHTHNPLSPAIIDPILNRLSSFLDRPRIRNIISQPNRIDFHEILNGGRILICNLSKGILGEDHASLLGAFILSRLQLCSLARAQLPPSQRRLYVIAVDEFHNYAGTGADTTSVTTFLSEARKYKVGLIAATQYTSQLNRNVQQAIFGNVGTLVCFRCGMADAQLLQRELGTFTDQALLNLRVGQAIVRMGVASEAFNVDVDAAVPPAESHREHILALSRERYCRTLDEVNAILEQASSKVEEESPKSPRIFLEPEALAYLERAAHHPEETVSAICTALNLSGSRGVRLRRNLVQQGYLQEIDTRLGQRGRRAKYSVPTFLAYQILEEEPPKGRGGPVHRHFAEIIAGWAEKQGYQISKEHGIDGGWVDLHLEREGMDTAVELSVTSTVEREMKNLKKCLVAGYSRILMLFVDKALLPDFRDLLMGELDDEEQNKVGVGSFNDFRSLL